MKGIIACGIIGLVFCFGCDKEFKENDRIREIKGNAIQACIDAGGIPIISVWENSLSDCVFPPQETIKASREGAFLPSRKPQ